jgi:hypothetical protein
MYLSVPQLQSDFNESNQVDFYKVGKHECLDGFPAANSECIIVIP